MTNRPSKCRGCPGHPKTSGYNLNYFGEFVPPCGPANADMLAIGIAPGEDEETRGVPFVGPAGKKLHTAIDWARAGRKLTIRKMNIFNCRTKKPGLWKDFVNRDPTAQEFRECAQRWLIPELQQTQAKVVLLLGGLPFDLVLKPAGVEFHRLPKVKHKFTFALCMGHRNVVPRGVFK